MPPTIPTLTTLRTGVPEDIWRTNALVPWVWTADVGTARTLEACWVMIDMSAVDPAKRPVADAGRTTTTGYVYPVVLDWTGPTCETVPLKEPVVPSTATSAEKPTLTDDTCELVRVPATSNEWVPMITMSLVVECAVTVSPTLRPTEATVPEIGLVSWAALRACWASIR